jgi:hypothetical protein
MPIAPVLQRFVDDELSRAPAMVERIRAGTLQLLRDTKDGLLPSERAQHFELVEALQQQGAVYERTFVEVLRAQVQQSLEETQGGLPSGPLSSGGGLELMDESSVETDIEISRAIQMIDTTAEWELRELQTFTSTLIGQTHVSAESNPLRPQIYATALWQAGCEVTPLPAQRATLLRLGSGVVAGLLRTAWAAASSRLEAQGVEPGIYRTVVIPAGSAVPARGPAMPDVNTPNAMSSLLASMPGGSAGMRVGVGSSAHAMGAAAAHGISAPPSAEFEQALARLDELLRHLPAPSATAAPDPGLAKRLGAHRAALVASANSAVERQAIELISRVFDSMLTDPKLQGGFVPVVARLRASALRVALRDPEMLSSTRHAVWLLLDGIGEASQTVPHAADPRSGPLLVLCKSLAEQLATAPAPDTTMYRRALTQLESLLTHQMQALTKASQPTIQALQLSERRELLERHLSQRLVDQMATSRTTQGVRRFVTGAWAKVLAESFIRHGEQSEITRGHIKLVDELLWSVQLPDHPKSRQRLIGLLPGLLKRLRAGMEMINLPAAEQESVLDELMTIHTEALRPNTRADAGPLTPEQIVQRMRDEVLPAATGHGAFSDSVIDLASMETIPAELMPESGAPAEDTAKRVEMLRVGDRLRLFVLGRWNNVQLLWRSDQGLFFLFAGDGVARTHSVTRRALERLASAHLLQPLETRTLVQRALDAVMREVGRSG